MVEYESGGLRKIFNTIYDIYNEVTLNKFKF